MRSNHGQERLFVYGTLHPTKAPPEVADVVARMKSVGRGTIQGVRYELESFPAVVSGTRGAGLVHGELYVLPEDPEALKRLDDYEEFYPQNLDASLFRRERPTVTLHDGTRERSWVYVYNQPISSALSSSTEAVAS